MPRWRDAGDASTETQFSTDKRREFDLSFLAGADVKPIGLSTKRSTVATKTGAVRAGNPGRTCIMRKSRMTRRHFLATTAASTAIIAMPHVRGAFAAGKLTMGFWDHWVPGANNTTTALVNEWAAKEKVEVSIDYITSVGNKNLLTIAAESQARSGHDIFAFPTWEPHAHAKDLEPVDDIMAELVKDNGKVNPTVEYLARANNKWVAVPATVGSQIKGPCSRIDLMKKHAGIDVQALYP